MAEFTRLPDVAMAALRLRDAAGQGLPVVGRYIAKGADRFIALGPDEWLAVADDDDASALLDRVRTYGGAVIDVSGNRVVYRVSGPDARWFLAAGCSFDLDRLSPGDAISTMLTRAQVSVVAEASDSFLVMPRRSFADYLERWAASVHG